MEQAHPYSSSHLTNTPPWLWRMRPPPSPSPLSEPAPFNLHISTHAPRTTTLSGAVYISPTPSTPLSLNLKLIQEVILRRDPSKRRARSSPSNYSTSPSTACTISLSTAAQSCVLMERVVARLDKNCNTTISKFEMSVTTAGRTWTWAGAEGERRKIWYLELRWRLAAELRNDSCIVGTAKNYIIGEFTPFDSRAGRIWGGGEGCGARRRGVEVERMEEGSGNGVFDDLDLKVGVEGGEDGQGGIRIGGRINAIVSGRLKGGVLGRVGVLLGEGVKVKDGRGGVHVDVRHYHRLAVGNLHVCGGGRQFNCAAEGEIGKAVFTEDLRMGEFLRIWHWIEVSVVIERRRGLGFRSGGAEVGTVGGEGGDLWELGENEHRREGSRVIRFSVPVVIRKCKIREDVTIGERSVDGNMNVPTLAVWGSSGRVYAVGTAEARRPRPLPDWVRNLPHAESLQQPVSHASELLENRVCDGEGEVGCAIDLLRRLAYEKGSSTAAASSDIVWEAAAEREVGSAMLATFPTFAVQSGSGSSLELQTCPVCLEVLRGGNVMMLPCLHAGHRSCLTRADAKRPVCPVCRLELVPYLVGGRE